MACSATAVHDGAKLPSADWELHGAELFQLQPVNVVAEHGSARSSRWSSSHSCQLPCLATTDACRSANGKHDSPATNAVLANVTASLGLLSPSEQPRCGPDEVPQHAWTRRFRPFQLPAESVAYEYAWANVDDDAHAELAENGSECFAIRVVFTVAIGIRLGGDCTVDAGLIELRE